MSEPLLPDLAHATLANVRKRVAVRPGVHALAPIMRWALVNGISKRARARVAAQGAG